MDATQTIRQSLSHVSALRAQINVSPALRQSLLAVKQFQARRFAATYRDLLETEVFAAPTRFFLEELYGERDFSERDAQFARIAGALQTFFPTQVVETATALAQLHARTESLDFDMAMQCRSVLTVGDRRDGLSSAQYVQAWRQVENTDTRLEQLQSVLAIGRDLDRLTRTRGLRMSLRLMRGPAKAAGLNALQSFLETGFDTFAGMGRQETAQFLAYIQQRESAWIQTLFNAPMQEAQAALQNSLACNTPS